MEKKGLFRWIWSINQIAMLIALLAFFWLFYKNEIKNRHPHKPNLITAESSTTQDPKDIGEWALGNTIEIYGSDYSMLPLIPEKVMNDENRPYLYYEGMTQGGISSNLLFINRKNNNSKWLFKENNQLIKIYTIFPDAYPIINELNKKDKFQAIFIHYKLQSKDTKKENLAISKVSGENYKVIKKDIDKLLSVYQSDKKSAVFLYQKDKIGYRIKISLDNFEVLSDEPLPKVGE